MVCVSYRASFQLLCVPRHMRFTAVAERKACAKNSNTTRIVIHKGSAFYSCCCWHHRCASVYSNVDFIVQPNSFPRFAPNHSLCIGGTSNELAPAERRMRAKRMYSKVRSVQVKEKKRKEKINQTPFTEGLKNLVLSSRHRPSQPDSPYGDPGMLLVSSICCEIHTP